MARGANWPMPQRFCRSWAGPWCPSPLLGTTLTELALLAAPEPDAETLGRLAEGTSIGALVFDADYVVNGDTADVVVAVTDGQLTRWTRFTAQPVVTMDPTRRLARVKPEEAEPIGADPGLADTAAILLAAEQIGAAERCLELTVEYTKEQGAIRPADRQLPGAQTPDGRFVRHDRRRRRPSWRTQATSPTPTNAATARLAATEALCTAAAEGIQLHGGIAITWEHDMHLYFKRAHGSAHLLGPPQEAVGATGSRGARNVVNDHVALRAGIPPFYVMDVWLAAAERQRSHGDLVNLSAGQPSVGAPEPVRAAAASALHLNELGYTVTLGLPELRAAIAADLPTPARASGRTRRCGGHHGFLRRIPARVSGMLRRG